MRPKGKKRQTDRNRERNWMVIQNKGDRDRDKQLPIPNTFYNRSKSCNQHRIHTRISNDQTTFRCLNVQIQMIINPNGHLNFTTEFERSIWSMFMLLLLDRTRPYAVAGFGFDLFPTLTYSCWYNFIVINTVLLLSF